MASDGRPLTRHPKLGKSWTRDLLGGRGFVRDGWNYSVKFGMFHLARSILDTQRTGHVEDLTRRFADKVSSEGWVILGPPLVLQPKVIDEALERPNLYSGRSGGLWHPRQLWLENTIPSDHPWVRNGEDLFLVRFPAKKKVEPLQVAIPEMALRYWRETNDPILQKLQFDDWKSSGSSQTQS